MERGGQEGFVYGFFPEISSIGRNLEALSLGLKSIESRMLLYSLGMRSKGPCGEAFVLSTVLSWKMMEWNPIVYFLD